MSRRTPGVSDHAQDRLEEYHGLRLSEAEWRDVVLQIIERRAVLTATHPPARRPKKAFPFAAETWLVRARGVEFRAVWSANTATIVTVRAQHHNREQYAREKLGLQRIGARSCARDTRRERRDDWRRDLPGEEADGE